MSFHISCQLYLSLEGGIHFFHLKLLQCQCKCEMLNSIWLDFYLTISCRMVGIVQIYQQMGGGVL